MNRDGKGYTLLVTGGSGFLGQTMLEEMLEGSSPVRVKEVRVYDLEPSALEGDPRVSTIRGDVRDLEHLAGSCRGVDLVIHSAAVVDWGTMTDRELHAVNVQGTMNVIEACRINGIGMMLYTSSLDVLFSGESLRDVNEDTPYPGKHSTSYCRTKYMAERLVLEANEKGLRTCVLRPSDIYGERDPYHIGNLIMQARRGFYVRLGNGKARSQHVYVGNIAHAHLLAARAMLEGNPALDGQAYFITDGPGSNFFTFFDRFVEAAGYRIRPRNLWLPRRFAYGLGALSEWMALLVRPLVRYRPKMSRFAVTYTCTDYTFGSLKAERDFGFTPKYGPEEAFRRTVSYFRDPPSG